MPAPRRARTAQRDLRRVPAPSLPAALAALHASLPVGAELAVRLPARTPVPVDDLIEGGGFRTVPAVGPDGAAAAPVLRRERTLPDRVGPDLRLLVCGLNASLYAADAGVPFARPGNRFWPAMVAAGLVGTDRARDGDAAFAVDRIGFTDLVKRASRAADEVTAEEYRQGGERLARLVAWLEPAVVCFLGLTGFRQAVAAGAVAGVLPGVLPGGFAGRPAYLAPNPSGLNAHCQLPELTAHLRAAAALGT